MNSIRPRSERDLLQEIIETIRYQHFVLEDIRKSLGLLSNDIEWEKIKQAAVTSRLKDLSSKEDPWPAVFKLIELFAEKWGKVQTQNISPKGIESAEAVGTPTITKKEDK